MASIVATPNPAKVGQQVSIAGEGFANATECTLSIASEGLVSEIVSSGAGNVASDAIADHGTQTITSVGVAQNNETVVIGGVTYTFKTTLTGAAYEVLIGAAATNSLDNLKAAINGAAGEGSTYGVGTVRHPDVFAATKTATTLVIWARQAGTAGNAIATTETMANWSWGAATLAGGAAAGAKAFTWIPTRIGTFTISVTDGSTTATTTLKVTS